MAKIIVVGSLNMDLVVRAAKIPIPGETVLGNDFGTYPGGKGANQAVAAARQGAEVTFIGRIGADAFGEQLLRGLQAEGIITEHIGSDEAAPTGVALITVDAEGENNIVVVPGANHKLTPAQIRVAESAFVDADVLLLQLETPLETAIAAAELAKSRGVKVVLNPAPAQPLPEALLSLVDILIPNETELSLLTGLQADTLEQVTIAARALLAQGPESVVVTLGARGALWVPADQPEIHVPSFPVKVADSIAAGDSFVGAVAVALADESSLKYATQRGCAAGALATTRPGAQPSIPTKAEIDQFMAKDHAA